MALAPRLKEDARRIAVALCSLACAVACAACTVESGPSRQTGDIEFDETRNLGATCGGPLTSWSVTNRETGEQGTAGCQQPVLFVDVKPGAYDFDIRGYAGSRLCWSGSCTVHALAAARAYADCSPNVTHLCGF